METLITERRLSLENSTEGPSEDPYSRDTYTVRINGVDHSLIMGLITRYLVDGVYPQLDYQSDYVPYDEDHIISCWESEVGMSHDTFIKAYHRVHGQPSKCSSCGGRKLTYSSGYAGEAIAGCSSCHKLVWCEPVTKAMIE